MSAPAPDPWPLTVATYNIHGGVGSDGRFAPERIARVLGEMRAEVIALQEVPLGAGGVLDILRSDNGLHVAEGPLTVRRGRPYGNAVLTRHPIAVVRTIDLSFGSREPRGAVDADLLCHGEPIRVVATHLGLSLAERRQQVARLLEAFDTARMPVILAGDLNEWFLWGRSLRRLRAHFQDAPAPSTFPSRRPILSLDRIWIRPYQRLVRVSVHATKASRAASDHLPLIAQIGPGVPEVSSDDLLRRPAEAVAP